MSGSNQTLSRPGVLPLWPVASPLNPAGLLTYSHPAGAGYEHYELPVSRLLGAKSGAPSNGTAQIAGITLATSSSTVGSWLVTIASPLLAESISLTVPIAVAVTTSANQALAIRAAIAAAIAADPVATANLTSTGSASTFSVTAKAAAATSADFTITAVKTGVDGTTQSAANTPGVLGTPADFAGQLSVNGTTVYAATNQLLNTWTAVN